MYVISYTVFLHCTCFHGAYFVCMTICFNDYMNDHQMENHYLASPPHFWGHSGCFQVLNFMMNISIRVCM